MWYGQGVEVHRKPRQANKQTNKLAVALTAATHTHKYQKEPINLLEVSKGEGRKSKSTDSYWTKDSKSIWWLFDSPHPTPQKGGASVWASTAYKIWQGGKKAGKKRKGRETETPHCLCLGNHWGTPHTSSICHHFSLHWERMITDVKCADARETTRIILSSFFYDNFLLYFISIAFGVHVIFGYMDVQQWSLRF